jgi:hypothetical protein
MPRTISLNEITLRSDGSIRVEWLKQIADDGEVVASEPHSTVVDFDGNYEAQLDAVFADLDAKKFRIPGASRNRMKRLVKALDDLARADDEITAKRALRVAEKKAALDALTRREEET